MPATINPMPPNMTRRSASFSNRRGKTSAATIEPAPKLASANATALWFSPKPACTMTTVLTNTMEPAAATAALTASSPRNLGVAR